MERSWLIDGRGIATKVKSATFSCDHQIKDCGANLECPNCQYRIDNSDVNPEWPGLPVGVKFEPSDEELVEHLAAKCGSGDVKPHMFIDEFIPTLDGEGIYSDHPENLPGAKKDGSSIHFFHKIAKAYSIGQRKRRKVQTQHGSEAESARWHKTGKTKPVIINGVQKGWKKIMVLYKSSKKGTEAEKSPKTNWVLHQYHLGNVVDEKEGEFVVSKICYQKPKHVELNDANNDNHRPIEDFKAPQTSPTTPNSNPPVPPRRAKSLLCDTFQEGKLVHEATLASENGVKLSEDTGYPTWFAGESQAVDDTELNTINDSLLCKETFDFGYDYTFNSIFDREETKFIGEGIAPSSVADLKNIENLQFSSQDSLLSWFDNK